MFHPMGVSGQSKKWRIKFKKSEWYNFRTFDPESRLDRKPISLGSVQ